MELGTKLRLVFSLQDCSRHILNPSNNRRLGGGKGVRDLVNVAEMWKEVNWVCDSFLLSLRIFFLVGLYLSWSLNCLVSYMNVIKPVKEILFKVAWVNKIRKAKFLIMKWEKYFLLPISEALGPSAAHSGHAPHYAWPPGSSTVPKTIYSTIKKSQLVTNWQCLEKN